MTKKLQLKSRFQAQILLAPAVILICLIFVYPLALAWKISFYDVSTYNPSIKTAATLANYKEMFLSEKFWKALLNTFIYTAGVTIISLASGMIFALVLEKTGFWETGIQDYLRIALGNSLGNRSLSMEVDFRAAIGNIEFHFILTRT